MVAVRADTQITDLTAGDHACLTFGWAEDRLDLAAAFVRDGLAGGLKVVWLSDAPPPQVLAALARRGIAAGPAALAGQMAAASADSLLPGQAFAAEHAMAWLAGQMAASQDEGYRPCRGRYRNGRHGWGRPGDLLPRRARPRVVDGAAARRSVPCLR